MKARAVHVAAVGTCKKEVQAATSFGSARPVAERFVATFRDYDYVVAPSASCVAMVRKHYHGLIADAHVLHEIERKTFELCEFLVDVLKVPPPAGRFPHRVGLHQSCHGLRELELGSSSERAVPRFSKVRSLLSNLDGIEFAELERADECCGFGGSFAVYEEAVSCMMGQDRVADHERAGTKLKSSSNFKSTSWSRKPRIACRATITNTKNSVTGGTLKIGSRVLEPGPGVRVP